MQIVSVLSATEGGFSTGYLVVEGQQQFAGKYLHVAFQNENLVARTTESPAVDKEANLAHPGTGQRSLTFGVAYTVSSIIWAKLGLHPGVVITWPLTPPTGDVTTPDLICLSDLIKWACTYQCMMNHIK